MPCLVDVFVECQGWKWKISRILGRSPIPKDCVVYIFVSRSVASGKL